MFFVRQATVCDTMRPLSINSANFRFQGFMLFQLTLVRSLALSVAGFYLVLTEASRVKSCSKLLLLPPGPLEQVY